jgi:hypothetical protein
MTSNQTYRTAIARAFRAAYDPQLDATLPWQDMSDYNREFWLRGADAVLALLPTAPPPDSGRIIDAFYKAQGKFIAEHGLRSEWAFTAGWHARAEAVRSSPETAAPAPPADTGDEAGFDYSPGDVVEVVPPADTGDGGTEGAWRVGHRVPKNVYVGDEVAGQFQREVWAREAVEAVNKRDTTLTRRVRELERALSGILWYVPFRERGEAWQHARTTLSGGSHD